MLGQAVTGEHAASTINPTLLSFAILLCLRGEVVRFKDLKAKDLLIMKAGWSEVEMEECGTVVVVPYGAAGCSYLGDTT